jgi:YfiH family protein
MKPEYLTSTRLREAGFVHAFFTRKGGRSSGPYESLNFSVAVGDDPALVGENLALAATELRVPNGRVYFLSQVHGTVVVRADGTESREAFLEREGDAVLGTTPGLACGVRSADCVPVLAGDERSGAVVAIHAGWRGLVRGVVETSIAALRAVSDPSARLVAAIGPHIRERAFEVSDDVAQELEAVSPVPGAVLRKGEKPHVSLAVIVRGKLAALGLADDDIDDVGGCTMLERERFFSFRRDGRVGGRHLSAIVPRGR